MPVIYKTHTHTQYTHIHTLIIQLKRKYICNSHGISCLFAGELVNKAINVKVCVLLKIKKEFIFKRPNSFDEENYNVYAISKTKKNTI